MVHCYLPTAQGLLLNIDIASQFDPATAQELGSVVEDCETCIARMNSRKEELLNFLKEDEAHTDLSTCTPIAEHEEHQ